MLCANQHETPSNLYSSHDPLPVNEIFSEHPLPTLIENPAEGREREYSISESEEIQSNAFFNVKFLYTILLRFCFI
jgi:hypothetical protein